jgi:hypothetical protein
MNINLGKIFPLILWLSLTLHAQKQVQYNLHASNPTPVVKEAVTITFQATQLDHTNMMFFFLEPQKSDDYKIELLSKKTTELSYHNTTTTFTFILFPLKAKELRVAFDFTIKVASDEAVAQIYTGGRDNVKWIDTDDTKLPISPLILKVKKLQKNVDLVGDFTLSSQIDKKKINPYESVNIIYTLKGDGYKEKKLPLLGDIPHVTLFSEIRDRDLKLTQEGYKIHREFLYALSADQNFTVPSVTLQAYSPKHHKFYTLSTPTYPINVEKLKTTTLLDEKEAPNTQPLITLETLQTFFIYLLIFASGYASGFIQKNRRKKPKKEKKYEDIKQASSPKELLRVLFSNYDEELLKASITELELLEYKKGVKNFQTIKKEILKKFDS